MADNKHLIQVGNLQLDDRMSVESKEYAAEIMREFTIKDIIQVPINKLRRIGDNEEKRVMKTFRFDNINCREVLIPNSSDGYEIPASIFTSTDVAENAPIVIFYHGGGWFICSRQSYYHAMATLASKTKAIWVSVEYRLAPEHKYKTQLTDYRAVVEWISQNREQIGGSKEAKLGVAGDSAGGHIATLMAHFYKSILDFQILVYPTVDLVSHYPSWDEFKAECYAFNKEFMDYCVRNYLEDPEMAKLPECSPMFMNDFSNLPKCLIVAAELDPLIDSIKVYHEKIVQSKSSSQLNIIKGSIHAFFPFSYRLKESFGECVNYIVKFLAEL